MNEQDKKFWFTEAVIIAGTPFIAYFFAFIFEASRVSVFKMPLEFINIGLPQVCIFALGLWGVVALVIMFVDSLSGLFPSSLTLLRRLMPVLPGGIVVLTYLFKGDYLWSFIYFILILILFCPSLIFSLFLFDGKNYKQKIKEWEQREYEFKKDRNSFVNRLMNMLGRENVGIIFFLIFTGLLLHLSGQLYAVRETTFLIPNNDNKQIVLGMYGDNAICGVFDRQTKIVKPVFTIYKLSSGVSFQSEELGPLKVVSLKNPIIKQG